ncbi:MAG: NAD-dependent epimerase/dehydratase family protein [Pseudomonadota bacterium]
MRLLVTGADGFIGRNLLVHLREDHGVAFDPYTRRDDPATLTARLAGVDAVIHLAGVNRPVDAREFTSGNVELTRVLCDAARAQPRPPAILFSSSIQATRDNDYGRSKRDAEELIADYQRATGAPVLAYRLPNVFGKWCRPNYNSAVATFCHNVARDLPISINDPAASLELVYVDDVVAALVAAVADPAHTRAVVEPVYRTTVGEVAGILNAFRGSRDNLVTERVGTGLVRALYATFVSYLPVERFGYGIKQYVDPRGGFMEMLKTHDSGQFSVFTAHPGVTRGGHYHHSKTEKFLVVRGQARFRFRQIVSGETHEILTTSDDPQVVETIPGWTHDITNIGSEEMIVALWANEIFDRARPDTYACPV